MEIAHVLLINYNWVIVASKFIDIGPISMLFAFSFYMRFFMSIAHCVTAAKVTSLATVHLQFTGFDYVNAHR